MDILIEKMNPADWQQARSIYLEGIATGNATFETDAPDWPTFDRGHFPFGRLVARHCEPVVGWAALSPVSNRCVYGGVAEISVYVASLYRGNKIGRLLLINVISESEQNGIWTLQAGIMVENAPSITIHIATGFREVGRREKIGKLHGSWRDVILLERRSEIVGVD